MSTAHSLKRSVVVPDAGSLITSHYPACTLPNYHWHTPSWLRHTTTLNHGNVCVTGDGASNIYYCAPIVPSAFAMGPVDPANLSHRSCFRVRHEPADAADYTDDNACFVCYEYVHLSISPPPFYPFLLSFPLDHCPLSAIVAIRKTFGS
ncbi:hypothetical protein BJ912DRAFT_1045550, partial [Pholiota molesta]